MWFLFGVSSDVIFEAVLSMINTFIYGHVSWTGRLCVTKHLLQYFASFVIYSIITKKCLSKPNKSIHFLKTESVKKMNNAHENIQGVWNVLQGTTTTKKFSIKGMQSLCSVCYLLSLWKCILHHFIHEGHCSIEIKTKWNFRNILQSSLTGWSKLYEFYSS